MSDELSLAVKRLLFRGGLPISDQRALFGVAPTLRQASKGDCLIEGGAPFSSLVILCSGMARKVRRFSDGMEQIVAVFVEGDALNAGEVVFRQSRNSVYALTPASYVSIPAGKLNDLITIRPAITRALWLETAVHAAIQQEWMIWLGLRAARPRLAHFLCELSYRLRLAGRDLNSEVEFPLTQNDLADALGMSTVHVNRSLQVLRGQGLIELTRSRLIILDRDGLYSVAEFDPQYLEGHKIDN
ncbi:Crp/Fnr family transcriptional regulator [Rhodopseudomonas palustris]|uniref:Crp/Fnr family transcriptional regulator n=1 Tax=Rhodopseudomonas palustris TaxID=1076 RepID=UPI000E5AB8C7|nr:Crp/Fnr family transcriptional regulator [Rhodopseudomonas palustris]QLH72341.1 Crp/Fnr family transcriptional regulator [Rhodopseudomonas palustris]RHZ93419.1 Crp/Fnr family transcriptional regulator [Rhodopseudomonas palustris]